MEPETELHIEKTRQEERDKSDLRYALKWVEDAFKWALFLVGGIILSAVILSAKNYIGI